MTATGSTDDTMREFSIGEMENWNVDRSATPPTMVRGIMGKTSNGTWEYISSSGNRLFVSGTVGASVTTAPLSADSSSISAKQGDAGNLRVSAFQTDAANLMMSAKSGDAGLFRVSALGVTATTAPLSADSSSVSAKQGDAVNLNVSAKSLDAGTLLVSAAQLDAGALHASAYAGDANQVHVSAVQGDAALQRVSAILAAGVSSVGAASFGVSAAQLDAGALHVSASLFPDTTGGLTIYNSISVSSIATVKSSAGAIYGYYAWNSDTKFNYIKLYNLSAGAQIGTDTPKLLIPLPASAAANVEFPHGLAGFTAGIMVGCVSAVPDSATSLPNTSAVGLQLFYK